MTDGQPMVSSEKPVVIKAEGKRLAFTSAGDQNGTVSTVQQNSKDNLSITAKELVVKAGNKRGRSEGIHLQNGNKRKWPCKSRNAQTWSFFIGLYPIYIHY